MLPARFFPGSLLFLLAGVAVCLPGITDSSAQSRASHIKTSGFDGAVLVRAPAGWFVMGSDSGDRDERPPARVFVSGF